MSWKTLSPQACLKSPEQKLWKCLPTHQRRGLGFVYTAYMCDSPAIHSEYVSQPFQSASSKSNPDLQVIEVGIILSTSALGKFQKFLRKQIGHTDTCLLRHKGARRRHRIHKSKHSTESTASVAVFAGARLVIFEASASLHFLRLFLMSLFQQNFHWSGRIVFHQHPTI